MNPNKEELEFLYEEMLCNEENTDEENETFDNYL